MGARIAVLLSIIIFMIAGCGQPVDYADAGNIYLDEWLHGLRAAAVDECAEQADPAQCRATLRTIIDAVIPPEMQTDALRQAN